MSSRDTAFPFTVTVAVFVALPRKTVETLYYVNAPSFSWLNPTVYNSRLQHKALFLGFWVDPDAPTDAP